MPQFSRLIASIPIATGAGSQTINTLLDALDISQAKAVTLDLRINTAATVVGTTLDVYLDATFDDPTLSTANWDARIHANQIPGNANVTNGYTQILNVSQDVDLQSSERGYTATGSGSSTPGWADLAAGTVRDGMFPPKFRSILGAQPNWRLRQVISDVANSGNFVGQATLYAHFWDT